MLDFHSASGEERLQAYRNVHDVWGRNLSMDAHLHRRLASPTHNRARWFVGCLDTRVVVSLACYDLEFYLLGGRAAGIAIGSVHTRPEYRRRGYARSLLSWVEEKERGRGARRSALYTDIDPGYYVQLGYLACPAWRGQLDPRTVTNSEPGSASLSPVSLIGESATVAALYDIEHSRYPIAIARDTDYWEYLSRKDVDDTHYFLQHIDGERLGYVRLRPDRHGVDMADWALGNPSDEFLGCLLDSVIHLARGRGLTSVGGWLPNTPAVRDRFALQARTAETPMLKSLDHRRKLGPDVIEAAQHFRWVDHV